MIDMQTEELLTLSEAAKRVPARSSGKQPDRSTVYRWAKHGLRGVRLESIRCGGTLCTSAQAIQRFCEALTEPVKPIAVTTPAKPSKAALLADARLAEMGM
jgi:Protein of unknown function (DUF1580)